jgi:DNA-directed RNA polymerase III subunit RPC5
VPNRYRNPCAHFALGELHLHAVNSVHQFRPTLTYLDVLSRKTRKTKPGAGSDSDSDDGPPPDPDEPPPPPTTSKREKKGGGDAKEVQVSARKNEDKSSLQILGGMSAARREMLQAIRAEDDEQWLPLRFHHASMVRRFRSECSLTDQHLKTLESEQAYENLFSQQAEVLGCNTDMTAFLS